MTVYRVKARWTGFNGAPGYTILHFGDGTPENPQDPNAAVQATRTFFASLSTLLATGVQIQIENSVEELQIGDGSLSNIHTVATPTAVTSGTTGSYAAPAGAVVHWLTSGVWQGRRVRGKTFLVPLSSSIYQSDGTLATAHQSTIQQAADALIADTASYLCVYSRPRPDGTSGHVEPVTGSRVPDMISVLRSRRD